MCTCAWGGGGWGVICHFKAIMTKKLNTTDQNHLATDQNLRPIGCITKQKFLLHKIFSNYILFSFFCSFVNGAWVRTISLKKY